MMPKLSPLLVPVLLLLALSAAPATAASPKDDLRGSVDRIMRLLDDEQLERERRNRQIREEVRNRFNFPTMSQWILGVHWRKASPEQRERFIDLFSRLLEATYKSRIEAYADRYTDETVEFTSERIKGDKALVTTLVHTKNQAIPIDYKLVEGDGKWQIYDVVIEEVSLVRNFRSTYDEVVRKEGFDSLFARMEEKIVDLKNAPKTGEKP